MNLQDIFIKIQPYVIEVGLKIITVILIFIIGKWVAHMLSELLEKIMLQSKISKTLAVFFKNITYYAILTFVAIACLNKLGIETNSFIAIIGAAGLAVGLALQGSLANFAAGVMIIIFQPFQLGDTIEAGGALGSVEEIQIFNTVLMSSDKKKIIVPNAKITGDKIIIHQKV